MHTNEVITAFLDQRRARGLAEGSLKLYRYWLDLWQSWRLRQGHAAELASVEAAELAGFLEYLAHEHIPHASNPRRPAAKRPGMSHAAQLSAWRILRAFWNEAAAAGMLTEQQLVYFRAGRVPKPRATDPSDMAQDRAVDARRVNALLNACGAPTDEYTARNRAIVLLLHESGLRVSELCSLDDESLDREGKIGRVCGKGGRWRFFFWSERTAQALAVYRMRRGGPSGGALFRSCGSRNFGGRISHDAVRGMLKRLADVAGVALPAGAPVHGFRSGFAQAMLDAGVESLDLMQLLGHARLETTFLYVRRHPTKLRNVYQRALMRRQTQ